MTPVDMAHEAVVERSTLADDSIVLQFLQSLQGQNDIHIFVGIAVIVVIVSDAEAVAWRVPWDDAISGIAVLVRHIKGFVILPVYTSRGNQRDSTV